ncbi:PilN domain-containing protein [Aromatoleum diolicum]|uniref:Fimbrial protein n=1 Tax=Aromatoleum diolicum TaxID=75796 RepID=A0ABX1QB90_9RHOO|nr:PilN domain-containing protein [Aromatoleum diolicum]NMG74291.1 fimbrial protein [Aromatoleum diolicum]
MIRINLLPHRELKRRERRKQFYAFSGVMVVVGLVIGVIVHTVIAGYVERQERRNAFLKTEITKLDAEIAEIKRLREQIDALLARKQVIESLQATRAQSVQLLNELATRVPDGVYLRSIKQAGAKIALLGYSQSNSRVSNLMRSLDESAFLEQPGLVEVKSATLNKRRVSDFALNINIERPKAEDEGKGAKK